MPGATTAGTRAVKRKPSDAPVPLPLGKKQKLNDVEGEHVPVASGLGAAPQGALPAPTNTAPVVGPPATAIAPPVVPTLGGAPRGVPPVSTNAAQDALPPLARNVLPVHPAAAINMAPVPHPAAVTMSLVHPAPMTELSSLHPLAVPEPPARPPRVRNITPVPRPEATAVSLAHPTARTEVSPVHRPAIASAPRVNELPVMHTPPAVNVPAVPVLPVTDMYLLPPAPRPNPSANFPTTHATPSGANEDPSRAPVAASMSAVTYSPSFRDLVEHGLMQPFIQWLHLSGIPQLPANYSSRQRIVSKFLRENPLDSGSTETLPASPSYTYHAILHLGLDESYEQWLQTTCGLDAPIGSYVIRSNLATAFLLEEAWRDPGLIAQIEDDEFKAHC
jgi:hypothetical protein